MLTHFEQKVAEALKQARPQGPRHRAKVIVEFDQWRADVCSIAFALDTERDAFIQAEFIAACGGFTT